MIEPHIHPPQQQQELYKSVNLPGAIYQLIWAYLYNNAKIPFINIESNRVSLNIKEFVSKDGIIYIWIPGVNWIVPKGDRLVEYFQRVPTKSLSATPGPNVYLFTMWKYNDLIPFWYIGSATQLGLSQYPLSIGRYKFEEGFKFWLEHATQFLLGFVSLSTPSTESQSGVVTPHFACSNDFVARWWQGLDMFICAIKRGLGTSDATLIAGLFMLFAKRGTPLTQYVENTFIILSTKMDAKELSIVSTTLVNFIQDPSLPPIAQPPPGYPFTLTKESLAIKLRSLKLN